MAGSVCVENSAIIGRKRREMCVNDMDYVKALVDVGRILNDEQQIEKECFRVKFTFLEM